MIRRRDLILASLAPANGAAHSPVQIQKLLFLVDQNLSSQLGAERYDFQPYNYGPFDKTVYRDLELLQAEGLVTTTPQYNWNSYLLTPKGQAEGATKLAILPVQAQGYLRTVSEFVRKSSFTELLSAIYRAYPAMAVNSVFQRS